MTVIALLSPRPTGYVASCIRPSPALAPQVTNTKVRRSGYEVTSCLRLTSEGNLKPQRSHTVDNDMQSVDKDKA